MLNKGGIYMLSRRPLLMAGVAAALLGGSALIAKADVDFSGTWSGALKAGPKSLRLRLVIAGAKATLFSLDQGSAPIPADEMHVKGPRLRLLFKAVQGEYDGRLIEGRIVGEWRQGGVLPLTFERGEPKAAMTQQPLDQARLTALRTQAGAPALAAAASRNGRRVSLVDGVRAIGRNERATTSDKWHLGSITKSMTATLVARCVGAGDVAWEDTVGGILGRAVPDMHVGYRDATFRHLLSHHAGLQANLPLDMLLRFSTDNPDPRAERVTYSQQALRQQPEGPKGDTYLYSNSGYVIAGAMLEAKLGAPWETLLRDRVFTPLDMKSAGFGAPGTPGAYDQPVGHAAAATGALDPYPPGSPVTDNRAVLGPAGRVHASLEDVLKYLAAHRDNTALLKAESWRALHTPPFKGDYALGWIAGKSGLWHNGSNTLWYAEVAVDPARGIVAVVATNDGRLPTATPAVHEAMMGAAAAVA